MNRYGIMAERYWETYLPSRMATVGDRKAFFTDLGKQVERLVVAGMEHQMANMPTSATSHRERASLLDAARSSAEEIALADLVLLPPEPGTENRRLVGSGPLPGWEDDEPGR